MPPPHRGCPLVHKRLYLLPQLLTIRGGCSCGKGEANLRDEARPSGGKLECQAQHAASMHRLRSEQAVRDAQQPMLAKQPCEAAQARCGSCERKQPRCTCLRCSDAGCRPPSGHSLQPGWEANPCRRRHRCCRHCCCRCCFHCCGLHRCYYCCRRGQGMLPLTGCACPQPGGTFEGWAATHHTCKSHLGRVEGSFRVAICTGSAVSQLGGVPCQ